MDGPIDAGHPALELAPTESLKDSWIVQHDVYPGDWWVEKYWNDTEGSHRDAIVRTLEMLPHFTSLLEVGCNTGPNLRRIHQRWPACDLLGMDIHPGAIKYGQLQAKAEGWQWLGYQGDLRDLHLLGKGMADVVLSCYALAYLDPRDIDGVLAAMLAAARQAVVICEPMVDRITVEEYATPKSGVPEYHYAYQDRVARLYGPHRAPEMTMSEVAPAHHRLKHVLTVLK